MKLKLLVAVFAMLAIPGCAFVPGQEAVKITVVDPVHGPAILVATPKLIDRRYAKTALFVMPIGNDEHLGFIINRRLTATLAKAFPEHEPSRKANNPLYWGGPIGFKGLYAVVGTRESPGGSSEEIAPGLFLVPEKPEIDTIIEKEAARTKEQRVAEPVRFFFGFVFWESGELKSELKKGLWHVGNVDPALIFREPTESR